MLAVPSGSSPGERGVVTAHYSPLGLHPKQFAPSPSVAFPLAIELIEMPAADSFTDSRTGLSGFLSLTEDQHSP